MYVYLFEIRMFDVSMAWITNVPSTVVTHYINGLTGTFTLIASVLYAPCVTA